MSGFRVQSGPSLGRPASTGPWVGGSRFTVQDGSPGDGDASTAMQHVARAPAMQLDRRLPCSGTDARHAVRWTPVMHWH
eukprot:357607-Chlamydomonas_euryale.AAC.6